jgi:death-on-curing family protein
LIKVLSNYNEALDLLDKYDHQRLQIKESSKKQLYKLSYKEAKRIIEDMTILFESGKLFGREKDDTLKSSLYQIYQTFDKKDLYPSIEEKAANLLYLLVKNHSFVDGNKRIAVSLFIWFMHKNNLLFNKHGIRIIENNMLVALTLMIAESRPEDKEMLIKVVVNLIQTE